MVADFFAMKINLYSALFKNNSVVVKTCLCNKIWKPIIVVKSTVIFYIMNIVFSVKLRFHIHGMIINFISSFRCVVFEIIIFYSLRVLNRLLYV